MAPPVFVIDLLSGYHQVELADDAKPKTAFVTERGLFQYNVTPFGLSNAPSHFQRLMEVVLSGINWIYALCYIDDIIVYASSFSEHIKRLELVLSALEKHGLKVKPSKCLFLRKEIPFLGHMVSKDGCKPLI